MDAARTDYAALETTAALLTALASSTKLAILRILATRPTTVGQLCDALDLSQSLVSHHLADLRDLDLVRSVRRKQAREYRLGPSLRSVGPLGSLGLEARSVDGIAMICVTIRSDAPGTNGRLQEFAARARSSSPSA